MDTKRLGALKAGPIQFSLLLKWAHSEKIPTIDAVTMNHAGVIGWVGGLNGQLSIGYLHGLSKEEALRAAKALENMGAI